MSRAAIKKEKQDVTRGAGWSEKREIKGKGAKDGIRRWKKTRWRERMRDERGDGEFSCSSPTSGEQMLDPQASTSMKPLKLQQTHIRTHTHTHHMQTHARTHRYTVCSYAICYPTALLTEMTEALLDTEQFHSAWVKSAMTAICGRKTLYKSEC